MRMNLVAATGKRLFPPDNRDARTTEALRDFFAKDIEQESMAGRSRRA